MKAKRDVLLTKIMEWHTDKNISLDDMKKKNVQALIQELFANATIHRISFKYVSSLKHYFLFKQCYRNRSGIFLSKFSVLSQQSCFEAYRTSH